MVSSSILVSTSDNSYYDYSKKNMLIISPLIQYGEVLLEEEAGVPGKNHRPWANNW
jgi:hypothetical protein